MIGCCSSYVLCSDAKRCIKPYIAASEGCYYELNLKAGKIFYGKNRNLQGSVKTDPKIIMNDGMEQYTMFTD